MERLRVPMGLTASPEPEPEAAMRSLFPTGVACALGAIHSLSEELPAEETVCIAGAALKRRLEFRAGRVLSRRVLAGFGISHHALVRGTEGLPAWPEGFTGCISHSGDYCGVAVAKTGLAPGLGFDLEEVAPMAPELLPRFAVAKEIQEAGFYSGRAAEVFRILLFSAKECFFKAQFQLWCREIPLRRIQCRFWGRNGFTVCLLDDMQRPGPETYAGRFAVWRNYVMTGITIIRGHLPK